MLVTPSMRVVEPSDNFDGVVPSTPAPSRPSTARRPLWRIGHAGAGRRSRCRGGNRFPRPEVYPPKTGMKIEENNKEILEMSKLFKEWQDTLQGPTQKYDAKIFTL